MRISDLSRQTGVPVATIKFYLRERLLPPGRPTARNQAQYNAEHRLRLSMIRALTSLGQLELSAVRELLGAIEDSRRTVVELLTIVNRALQPTDNAKDRGDLSTERAAVDAFVDGLRWTVADDAPSRTTLAQVLAAMERLGCGKGVDFFKPYAVAAEQLANQELDLLEDGHDGGDREAVVVRAILVEVANTAIRRLAYEHLANKRFPGRGPD